LVLRPASIWLSPSCALSTGEQAFIGHTFEHIHVLVPEVDLDPHGQLGQPLALKVVLDEEGHLARALVELHQIHPTQIAVQQFSSPLTAAARAG
jgi:hypothetical protein